MTPDYDDVNSPEFQEAMDKATGKTKAKEYQPTANEKQLIVKLAQISPKMYRNIRNGLTMMLSQGTEQQRAAAQKYIDVMNQVERENPDLKKAVNNPPQLSDAEQRAKDMEFLRYYAQEFPNEFNDMIKFLDFYKSSPLIQSYVGMMREVQQETAAKPSRSNGADNKQEEKPAEDKTQDTPAAPESKTDENDDDNKGFFYISDNVEHALKMGPTVLKEYMEKELGIEFPADIIRHNTDGGEYIPTRLLRQWFENNRLTDEQMDKLNALVDDRAAFDTKVREINERDHYVAPSRQTESSQAEAEQAAEDTTNSDTEKLKQYAAKGNIMTDPAILREMKEKDPELYTTFHRTLRDYLNPRESIYVDEMYHTISTIADGCGVKEIGDMSKLLIFAQKTLNTSQEIEHGNQPKPTEKRIDESINVSGDTVYQVSGYGTNGTFGDKELIDGTYTIRKLKDEKYEVTYQAPNNHYQTSRTYYHVNLNNSDSIPEVMRALDTESKKLKQQQKEAQEAQKKQEDIEKMRELMRNNPKKFQDVKNAYKAALKSDSKTITEQASYYLAIIEDVEKDEATKEKVRQERERAIKKLEKEIKKLEKQAKKLREKGEKEKAEKMKQQADEKRETLEKMRKDGENVKPDEKGKTDAKPEAAKAQEHAVEQRIIDSRRNGGNSMA